jgi:transposase
VFGPFLGYLWCLARLLVPGPSGRKRYNVLAALNAVTHEVIRVANHSYINATSVCDLLRQVAAARLPRPITLVLDNARYQRCKLVQALARSLRIELLFLPSYSPNLNLIERLWKFLKKECLASRPLPDYETFTQTIDDGLSGLRTKYQEQMTTLLTLNFQRSRGEVGDGPEATQGSDQVADDDFAQESPLEDGNVLLEVPLADSPERPQEVTYPGPDPFQGVVVHFPHAVPVVIPGPFPRAVANRAMATARLGDPAVPGRLVGV